MKYKTKFKIKAWIIAIIIGWSGYHCLYIKRYFLALLLSLNLILAYYSIVTINAYIFLFCICFHVSAYIYSLVTLNWWIDYKMDKMDKKENYHDISKDDLLKIVGGYTLNPDNKININKEHKKPEKIPDHILESLNK